MSKTTLIHDIAILGDGISGNAVALMLARVGLRVVLLSHSKLAARLPVGEHLAPQASPILQAMSLQSPLKNPAHLPSPGAVTQWGSAPITANSYSASTGGSGVNLDRVAFDADLREWRGKAGVVHIPFAKMQNINRNGGVWDVSFENGNGHQVVQAHLLVDATGRAAFVARRLGAVQQEHDKLIALVGRFNDIPAGDNRLHIADAPEGWFYALRQTGGRSIVVYLTDADLLPAGHTARRNHWQAALPDALRGFAPLQPAELQQVDARSMVLQHSCGAGWLAVADAAMSFDPISAAGITKALRDAQLIRDAIMNNPTGQPARWAALQEHRRQTWQGYLAQRHAAYAACDKGGTFWQRRRSHPA